MNKFDPSIGQQKSDSKSDAALAQYAKLVEAAQARKKTWAEIAEQIKALPPIKLDKSSAEIIREIRDEL